MFLPISIVILLAVAVQHTFANEFPEFSLVPTSYGPIRGRLEHTQFENRPYYAFKGFPYAQPPIRRLRFLPPISPRPWRSARDCFEYGQICLQDSGNGTATGSEDCLYLNVFTPALAISNPPNRLRAVMFYIHGGAWYHGHGSIVGPDFLLNKDIVVVTINYRLGVLGFMSLGTADYSGNQGIKDQQFALQWIHANIRRFGGDPDCVTIFGDSAGAMSNRFHMWAPGSRDLYRRAIEISFTLDVWSIGEKKDHHTDLEQFARQTNVTCCSRTRDLVQFLQRIDATTLMAAFPFNFFQNTIMPTIESATARWPLTVNVTASDLMMESDHLRTDIDVMIGYTTGEALFLAKRMPHTDFVSLSTLKLPNIRFNRNYESAAYKRMIEEIEQFYQPIDVPENLERLKSDVHVRYFIDRQVKQLASKSTGRTYYYRFGMESSLNYFKGLSGAKWGASHGDDICYISRCNYSAESLEAYSNLTKDSEEYEMIDLMAGMYADFAKYGHPFVSPVDGEYVHRQSGGATEYEAVEPGRYTFVDIKNDGVYVGENPFEGESEFWDRLMVDYASLLVPDSFDVDYGKETIGSRLIVEASSSTAGAECDRSKMGIIFVSFVAFTYILN